MKRVLIVPLPVTVPAASLTSTPLPLIRPSASTNWPRLLKLTAAPSSSSAWRAWPTQRPRL